MYVGNFVLILSWFIDLWNFLDSDLLFIKDLKLLSIQFENHK